MPDEFFKVDVNVCDHPKVIDLSDAAFRVWIASIATANRRMTDGFIATAVIRRFHDCDHFGEDGDTPEEHAHELVAAGLWDEVPGGWQVHNFAEHNRTREERLADREHNREGNRERQQRYRERQKARSEDSNADVTPVTERYVTSDNDASRERQSVSNAASRLAEESRGEESREDPQPSVEQARPSAADIEHVFETWKKATGKHKAQLDSRRRRKITDVLKAYPHEDVLAAVQGWANSPHHRGENERGTVYNDLELLLRDARHIEMFRDFYHGDGFATASRRAPGTAASADEFTSYDVTGRIPL